MGAATALLPFRGIRGARRSLIPEDKEDFDDGDLGENLRAEGRG